jgi:hypothetical protein
MVRLAEDSAVSYLGLARRITRELEGRTESLVVVEQAAISPLDRSLVHTVDKLQLPAGVRLLSCQPKEAPVAITTCSVVIDVDKFVRVTLGQLDHALKGENWLAGNWSVRALIDRLEQVGIFVEVEN